MNIINDPALDFEKHAGNSWGLRAANFICDNDLDESDIESSLDSTAPTAIKAMKEKEEARSSYDEIRNHAHSAIFEHLPLLRAKGRK